MSDGDDANFDINATIDKKKKISHRPRLSVAWELIPFAAL